MILDLDNPTAQDRYIPDVRGLNFSVLMPDLYSKNGVRSLRGLGYTVLSSDPAGAASGSGSIQMKNLRTGQVIGNGQRASFRAGDSWSIQISGAQPNTGVWLNAQLGYYKMPYAGEQDLALSIWTGSTKWGNETMGTTDANGNWSASGTFRASQVGSWHQLWNAGPSQFVLDFDVADASGVVPVVGAGVVPAGSPNYLLASNHPAAQQYTPEQLARMAQPRDTATATTATNRPNQSVPPSTPITTIPNLPASTPTRQVLTSAYSSGPVFQNAPVSAGIDNKTLLLGAAALVAVILAVK